MILVGLQIGTQPPPAVPRAALLTARAMRLESLMRIDHFQSSPSRMGRPSSRIATQRPSPHEMFD
jgi:phthiodiolone/phenolphthiodiolone dimycocerosates ketoreductase